jgi:predicted nucleic acid-binding protein
MLRDPGDDMILETAINGRASAIVSYNHKDFGDVPQTFSISLLKPYDVVRKFST